MSDFKAQHFRSLLQLLEGVDDAHYRQLQGAGWKQDQSSQSLGDGAWSHPHHKGGIRLTYDDYGNGGNSWNHQDNYGNTIQSGAGADTLAKHLDSLKGKSWDQHANPQPGPVTKLRRDLANQR